MNWISYTMTCAIVFGVFVGVMAIMAAAAGWIDHEDNDEDKL